MTGHALRHLALQVARRTVQVAVCALIVGLAVLSLYAHYRAARALDDAQLTAGWKGTAFRHIDDRVAEMDDPEAFLDGYKGTLWSMRVAGVDLTDPLAVAEMAAAAKTIHVAFFLTAAIPLAFTLLLGKVFCSWICPAGLLFEVEQQQLQLPARRFGQLSNYIGKTFGRIAELMYRRSRPIHSFHRTEG